MYQFRSVYNYADKSLHGRFSLNWLGAMSVCLSVCHSKCLYQHLHSFEGKSRSFNHSLGMANISNQLVTKLKNSNCDKTTKLKNSNCDKTQKFELCKNSESSNSDTLTTDEMFSGQLSG